MTGSAAGEVAVGAVVAEEVVEVSPASPEVFEDDSATFCEALSCSSAPFCLAVSAACCFFSYTRGSFQTRCTC